jgi:hypothetical protein
VSAVYFIQPVEGGPIKIGWANDVDERLKKLQSGHWLRLRIVALVENQGEVLELARRIRARG